MGFYDCRCLVTGIALAGETVAVLIRGRGNSYQPISLPISGQYNFLGMPDRVEEDLGTDVSQRYFNTCFARWTSATSADRTTARSRCRPPR